MYKNKLLFVCNANFMKYSTSSEWNDGKLSVVVIAHSKVALSFGVFKPFLQ